MDENGVHHHEWGDWEITIDGTYQQEGVKERVCTKCGEKETAKISRQVCLHKWGWVITQAQLLKEGGTKRHYTWTGFLDMIDHRHPVVRPKAFYVYSWCLIPRLESQVRRECGEGIVKIEQKRDAFCMAEAGEYLAPEHGRGDGDGAAGDRERGGEGVLEMYYGQGSRSDQKTVQVCDTERTLPKRDGNLRGDAEGKGRGASCGFY